MMIERGLDLKAATFKRGVHPPDEKSYTNKKQIEIIMPRPGTELVYPMLQHIGAPCEPIVEIGEKVLLGQKIADSSAFVSAPVHASVSGVVKEFRKTLTPTGIISDAIVIETDGKNDEHPSIGVTVDYKSLSREKILQIIRNEGIVGLGGAGFPTHIKLNPPPDKKIDTLIVNAAECEPYLTTDHRVLIEETERVITGLEIMMQIMPGVRGVIAVENNKPDVIEKMTNMCNGRPIDVIPLITKYPQGSEKQLINAVTGREVPSGGLPADVGCIVNNVDTVVAINRAVARRRPLTRKVVTISGGAVNNPGNFKVKLGMKYSDLIDVVGGYKSRPYKMISGGPMMGVAMFTDEVPIIKTSSAFLCFTEEEAKLPPERNCIRCGKCVAHCPMALMPLELNAFVVRGDIEGFKNNNGMDCVECGSCSYICPAKRHLAQSIRATRRALLAQRKK